jgi:hypothetical protein
MLEKCSIHTIHKPREILTKTAETWAAQKSDEGFQTRTARVGLIRGCSHALAFAPFTTESALSLDFRPRPDVDRKGLVNGTSMARRTFGIGAYPDSEMGSAKVLFAALLNHTCYYWPLLAESHQTQLFFGSMPRKGHVLGYRQDDRCSGGLQIGCEETVKMRNSGLRRLSYGDNALQEKAAEDPRNLPDARYGASANYF